MYLSTDTELNNRYIIKDVLGHGGFGITYTALDKVLNVKVAIKEYLPRQSATRGEGQTRVSVYTGEARKHYEYGLRRFLEEAQSIAQFSHHPNIVSARDYFESNNTAYMVMEYIEGVTFKEYLEKKGDKILFEEAKSVMMPVMDALREIHEAGLLHRDISPDNIYITTTGQVKLLDFGAARYYAGEQSKSLSVILKPGYAPEEQYRSSGKQGTWTDVYATGATLYRSITGKTPPDALDRKEEDTLEPPSRLGISIPDDAEKALLKALAINAPKRFKTILEFQSALINGTSHPSMTPAYEATSAILPEQSKIASPSPEAVVKNPVKPAVSNTIWVFAGVIVLVVGGILIWSISASRKSPASGPSVKVPHASLSMETQDPLDQGISYLKNKDYEKAIDTLKRAMQLDPKNARVYFNLGLAYFNLERYQDAIDALKKGIRLNPDESGAYRYLGMAYGHLNRPQDAIANLKEAVRLNPNDTSAHFILGKIYVHDSKRDLALAEYNILKDQDGTIAADLKKIIDSSKRPISRKALQREIDRMAQKILEKRKAQEQGR